MIDRSARDTLYLFFMSMIALGYLGVYRGIDRTTLGKIFESLSN